MKKYIENLEVQNFDEVNNEINLWKNNVLDQVNIKNIVWKKWVAIVMAILGLVIILVMLILTTIPNPPDVQIQRHNQWIEYVLYYGPLILGASCFGFSLWYVNDKKNLIKKALLNIDINPYTFWLDKVNDNLNVDKNYKPIVTITKLTDYNEMKYRLSGATSIGLYREYELSKGIIFNNPYELSCGIWHSLNRQDRTSVNYFDYMPLLKIKTNLFPGEKISITNSKIFGNFTKKDIQLEDETFNNIFSIKSSDENVVRMILTPVVQNKWKDMEDLPPFNMSIENGFIRILFQPKTNFMDTEKLSDISFSKFKNLEPIIWKDIKILLNIINLAFSISIIQFEDASNLDNFDFV